jgi:hypothetical protein
VASKNSGNEGGYGPQGGMPAWGADEQKKPGEFWDPAIEKKKRDEARRASESDPEHKARRRRGRRRIILGFLLFLVLLVVGVIALAPTIASSFAPGIVKSAAAKQIMGSVEVSGVSLSWGGPQKIEKFTLLDSKNRFVAEVSAEASTGLLSLAMGGLTLGQIDVAGKAYIERAADGSTNVQDATAPRTPATGGGAGTTKPPAKKGEPAKLPKDLSVTLKLDKLRLAFVDNQAAGGSGGAAGGKPVAVTVDDVKGEVTIKPGEPIRVKLGASAAPIAAGDDPRKIPAVNAAAAGTLAVDAKITNAIGTDGVLQPERATVDATIDAKNVPVDLVDALSGQGGKLLAGLGDRAQLNITAKGDAKAAAVELLAASSAKGEPRVLAQLSADVKDNVLTLRKPAEVRVPGVTLGALAPQINDALAKSNVTVAALPDATLLLQNLKAEIPQGGKAFDLGAIAIDAMLKTGAVTGTVALPQPGAAPPSPGTPAPLGPPKPFSLAEFNARVQTDRLGGEVKVTAATSATLDNQPAGQIDVNATASGLIGADGKPVAGVPANLTARAMVKGMSTAIAQPFAAAAKLDLPADVGPTIDLDLTANTKPAAGNEPQTLAADVTLTSANVNLTMSADVTDRYVRLRGNGLDARINAVSGIAQRFIPPTMGWTLQPGGEVRVQSTALIIPTVAVKDAAGVEKREYTLDGANGALTMQLRGVTATPPADAGSRSPIRTDSLDLAVALSPTAAPKLTINAAGQYENAPFTVVGGFDMLGMVSPGAPLSKVNPGAIRPQGSIEIRDLPTALVALMPKPKQAAADQLTRDQIAAILGATPTASNPVLAQQSGRRPDPPAGGQPAPQNPAQPNQPQPNPPPATAGPALDIPRLIQDVLGPKLSLKLDTKPVSGKPDALDVSAQVNATRLTADVSGQGSASLIDLKTANVQTTLDPALVRTLLATFAPQMSPAPELAAPAPVTLSIAPITIPLMPDGKPDYAKAGLLNATIAIPQTLNVRNLVVKNADGSSRDFGTVGLEGLELKATMPMAGLAPKTLTSAPSEATATLATRVLSGDANAGAAGMQRLATLNGRVTAPLVGGKPEGTTRAAVQLTEVNVAAADRLAQQNGLLPAALGATMSLDANVQMDQPPALAGQPAPKPTIRLDALARAPQLTMDQPLKAEMLADRLRVTQPTKLTLTVDPSLVERLTAPKPGAPAANKGTQLRLQRPTTLNIALNKLSVSQGQATDAAGTFARGPMLPGIFEADVQISMPDASFAFADGQVMQLSDIRSSVTSAAPAPGQAQGPLAFNVGAGKAGLVKPGEAQASGEVKALSLSGTIANLADARGNINTKAATLSAIGDIPAMPTDFVDALAKQNGLLVAALGPAVSVNLRAERFPLGAGSGSDSGFLDAGLTSQRATAKVRGSASGNVFVADSPMEVRITEITKELTEKLVKGLPSIGSIEKKPTDVPAMVTASNLRAPTDGNLANLNADVLIDPGEARFGTSALFGRILKPLGQKTEGVVGRKLEPLTLTIRNGVATYSKYSLPLGEFRFDSEGTVDLVGKQLDVITWIPLGALTDEAAGAFNTGLGSLLQGTKVTDALTLLPFRSKGPLSDPGPPKPDLELYVRNIGKSINPVDRIKEGLGDLFKKKK